MTFGEAFGVIPHLIAPPARDLTNDVTRSSLNQCARRQNKTAVPEYHQNIHLQAPAVYLFCSVKSYENTELILTFVVHHQTDWRSPAPLSPHHTSPLTTKTNSRSHSHFLLGHFTKQQNGTIRSRCPARYGLRQTSGRVSSEEVWWM